MSCPSEQHPQSEGGPGIVGNYEGLLRHLFTPDHVRDGMVLEAAFSSQDLKERGLSVNRKGFTNAKTLEAIRDRYLLNNMNRRFFGLAEGDCGAVRTLSVEGTQAFCVVDNIVGDNNAHAHIICRERWPQSQFNKLREQLINIFGTIRSIDESMGSKTAS